MYLELIFTKNPHLAVVLGDFNVKLQNWYEDDKTTASRTKPEIMTSHYGLTQIINESTHMLEDASSCIDLIFTSQSNMVLDSGVHSSLHPNSHHQFVFTKFNLKVYALASFNWEQALSNSSIDKKISILNETIINVMSNYISNETKVFDDQKSPWMKAKIEKLITAKNDAFRKHLKNNRNHYYTYKYKAL